MQKQSLWNRHFLFICLSSFFIFINFYTLLATLPMFVMDDLKGSNQQIGLVMTFFIATAVLMRPFAGKWLDLIGRKKILLIALSLFLVSSVLYFMVHHVYWLLVLRLIHGVSFGIGTTATGTIATDLIPEDRKGEGIGYYATFMNLAMVVGPFLGLTIISHYHFTVLFMMLSFFSLLAFLFGTMVRTPKSAFIPKAKPKAKEAFHWKSFVEPNVIPVSLTVFFVAIGYSGVLTFLSVYAKNLGLIQAASYFFVVYAVVIVISRPVMGRLLDRFSGKEHFLIYPCVLLFVIGLITLSLAHTSLLFFAASALIGLGNGSLFPILQAIVVKSVSADRRGVATGTFFLLYDTGIGTGSVILGGISSAMGYPQMYFVSALIVSCSILIYYVLCHRKRRKHELRTSKFLPSDFKISNS